MKIRFLLFLLIIISVLSACKKEKSLVYGVDDVEVRKDGNDKQTVKTTNEFISIAYSDIFGTTIPQSKLAKLTTAYLAFGDKKLIEDMIIKNFLNQSGATIPTIANMNENVPAFVKASFRKFFNRDPNELEEWQMTAIIKGDATITPELVYYTFLTSNEYRYY